MLFSEPIKAIPKRWMHFRTANIYFEVWETRHTGYRSFAIEVGLSQCRRLPMPDQQAISPIDMSGRKRHLWSPPLTETFSFLAINVCKEHFNCPGLRRLRGVRGANSGSQDRLSRVGVTWHETRREVPLQIFLNWSLALRLGFGG
jgi:hypothetical protein